jgi:hypothetical protein
VKRLTSWLADRIVPRSACTWGTLTAGRSRPNPAAAWGAAERRAEDRP